MECALGHEGTGLDLVNYDPGPPTPDANLGVIKPTIGMLLLAAFPDMVSPAENLLVE